jgi:KaiC/GvpD/RAD55 family RecA-like ATPase
MNNNVDPAAEVARIFGNRSAKPTAVPTHGIAATFDSNWSKAAFDNPKALLANAPRKRASTNEIKMIEAALFPFHDEATRPRIYEDADGTVTTQPMKSERRYPLYAIDEIENSPPARYIVKNVLMHNSISALYGPSGSGKTFLAYLMAFAISDGEDFFDYRIAPCEILIISLEGQAGLAQRVQAQRKRGSDGQRIKFSTAPLSLNFADDIEAIIATANDHGINDGLIILDTLNASMAGLDENSSADMGRAVAALKHLRDKTGCAVLVIHHSGKDASKGLRGHSLLHAALDSVIEVTRDGDRRSWKLAKSKDGADGEEHPFRLEVVELGTDDDGDIITSCVVVPEESTGDAMRRTLPPKSGNQRIIWNAIGELLRDSKSFGKAGAPVSRPCVEIETAVDLLRTRLACEPKRQTERARSAISGLVERGLLILREGWLWAA